MTNEQRNKIIAEALGICWHEDHNEWVQCACWSNSPRQPFDNWLGFGVIMEKGPRRKWWCPFWESLWEESDRNPAFFFKYLNEVALQVRLSDWLSKNREKWKESA